MPTLAADISKKKQARVIFLFDSSRTNIVLLKSNKKLTSGPLFFNIFGLKVCIYPIPITKPRHTTPVKKMLTCCRN